MYTPSPSGSAPPSRWIEFRRSLGRLLIAALWIWTVGLLLWNLLRFYPGDVWGPVRMGNYFAPWLFLLSTAGLVIAALARRPWLAGALSLLALLFLLRYAPLFLPQRAPSPPANAVELRVISFNVGLENRDRRQIGELIRDQRPDLIALQAVDPNLFRALRSDLSGLYAHYWITNTVEYPLGLISRYPLAPQTNPEGAWRSQRAVIEIEQMEVTVWNLHTAPAFTHEGWRSQHSALRSVGREIIAQDDPLLLLGDLNTTDQTDEYRLLTRYLTDVHRAVGRGFGFTFPTRVETETRLRWLWPLLRLDYIMVNERFIPRQIRLATGDYGSDHRPVIADLYLLPPEVVP